MARAEIGPYRILRLIKRGGGGSVYVAHDQRLDRKVALKFIAVPRERETRQRVVEEARMLAAINHHLMVQVFDVVEVHSHVILVMEYVPGTDLENLLQQSSLDMLAILQLGMDLCAALAAAHQAGIVHRDLKAANVLVDNAGHIKLTDFGIAHYLHNVERDGITLDNPVPGSYQAMSPEQAAGERIDFRSDLFALGLLFYRLLSGRHPFADGGNELQTLQQVISEPHVSLLDEVEDVPPRLSRLVDGLLNKQPEYRPTSALLVRQDLLSIMRDMPLTRGHPLSHYVPGATREEDTVESGVELPAGFARGARSHMLSASEWGPWVFNLAAAGRRASLVALVSLLVIGSAFAASQWLNARRLPVSIEQPLLVGATATPSVQQFTVLLQESLAGNGSYRPSVDPAAGKLLLQVNCNPYICGMQLSLRGETESVTDYRTLVPGASEDAWRAGIKSSLEKLAREL